MPAKVSALLRYVQRTRILLAVFFVLVIVVVFIGLDSLPGYITGYLATTLLFFIATRNWRRIRRFLILFVVSLFGIVFLSFLYVEVICRIAIMIGGLNALQGTPVGIIEIIINTDFLFLYFIK